MAALLRHGATRMLGGSMVQRAATAPAVAEERRRILPRRFSTDAEAKAMAEIQQQKEALYVAFSKVHNWRNVSLLQGFAAHIKPRPQESQWRRLRSSRRSSTFITLTGLAGILHAVVNERYREAIKRRAIKLGL